MQYIEQMFDKVPHFKKVDGRGFTGTMTLYEKSDDVMSFARFMVHMAERYDLDTDINFHDPHTNITVLLAFKPIGSDSFQIVEHTEFKDKTEFEVDINMDTASYYRWLSLTYYD